MERCLSENTLQDLAGGGLPGDALARAQAHLERCRLCRTLVVELFRDSDTLPLGPPRASDRDRPQPGLTERFEILHPLGRGGMGMVYEALDRERGARIALKTLQHVSPDGLLRFKNEFRAVQDVQHPNLVTLGELIEDRGQWWLTMELVDGVELLAHVRPGGTLDEARLRAALPQVASALQALHARGLVHRDVKPHNVLVTPAGRVVLLDFGLVTRVDQSESNVVGTPAYMAPEQGMGHEIGPPADWYGVGALLYEALTGALPFDGPPLQVLAAKQDALPRRPRELASVPEDLDALCMDLLAIDPAARPDAAAVLARLAPDARRTAPAAAASPLFVGRRQELDLLAETFARTRARREAAVLVRGESGIGKSALVRRFCDELRGREPAAVVLAGKCYEREAVPYRAFDGVVDALTRHLRKLPRAEAEIVLPRRASLLVQAFPVLAKVPALRALPAEAALDAKELRVRAFSALRELLGRLAERVPLVVCIDDLQWADADSLELLGHVMAPPDAPPLCLIMTSRPQLAEATDPGVEAGMARLHALASMRVLELGCLAREEAVRLAEHLLAEAPAPGASAASVADEAAGHPLFIDALVRFAALDPAGRPGIRLADALWARVSALDEPTRQLLFLVAVAGWPVSLALVVAMAAVPAGALDGAVARLRQAGLVRLADGAGKGALEPYHDRVREAVLDRMDGDARRRCHRALASALLDTSAVDRPGDALPPRREPAARDAEQPASSTDVLRDVEAIAVHLHGAGELAQAAQYMAMAADRAAAALAFDRAARLYRQALALHAQGGEPADVFGPGGARDVLARLARTLANASRGAEAAAVYLELARLAGAGGEEYLRLRLLAAEQLLRGGHMQEGQRELDPVLDELGMGGASTRLGVLWRFLWRRVWLRVRGFGHRERAGVDMTARERLRMDACRAAWMNGWSPDYMARYQLMALRTGEPARVGVALFLECLYTFLTGATTRPRSARIIEQLAALATRTGEPYLLGLAATARSLVAFAQGKWLRSREHGAQALQIFRERCPDAAHEFSFALAGYFDSTLHTGALRELVRELAPVVRDAQERGDRFTLATLHNGPLVWQWLIQDQPEAARRQIQEGLALWTPRQHDSQRLIAKLWNGLTDLYQGAGAAAYRGVNRGMRKDRRQTVTRSGLLVVHGLAALAACRSGEFERRRLVREVVRDARGLRALGMAWTDALARVLDAGVASVTNDRAQARDHLARAHAELTGLDMMLWAMMARRRLGELTGGAEGQAAIAEADAWLRAQGVVSPERLARAFMPELA